MQPRTGDQESYLESNEVEAQGQVARLLDLDLVLRTLCGPSSTAPAAGRAGSAATRLFFETDKIAQNFQQPQKDNVGGTNSLIPNLSKATIRIPADP